MIFGCGCDIIENRIRDGQEKSFWASSLFVCVTRTYMILFILKSIYGNVNSIYCHMVLGQARPARKSRGHGVSSQKQATS